MRRSIFASLVVTAWIASAPSAHAQLTATEGARLFAPSFEADIDDNLGASVDISGSTMIAGVPGRSTSTQSNLGAAYIFFGSMHVTLTSTPRHADAQFGTSVAIDGTTAVVGAEYEATSGTGTEEGVVYVFDGSSGTWSQTQRITGPSASPGDDLGAAVAIDGDTMILGAPGRATKQGVAFVATRSGGTWTIVQTLTEPTPHANRGFGTSVAISGDHLIVGASAFGNTVTESAHVFERDASGTWSHVAELTASDGSLGDGFGWAVAIDGDRALVGAPSNTGGVGAVYVYERTATGTWMSHQKLTRPGATGLGNSVAIAGDLAIAGAAATSSNAGQVHAFLRDASGAWGYGATVPATAAHAGDYYGAAIALDGARAVIGAYGEDVEMPTQPGWDDGAAHPVVFQLGDGSACTASSAALCSSTFCVDSVCCTTACDGDCDACSTAAGASANGSCTLLSGVVCRAAADACDIAEMCTGSSASCPADMTMPGCTTDSGAHDAGAADGGARDGGSADASHGGDAGTIPRRTLSCTCRVGATESSGAGALVLAVACLALIARRRRR